MKSAAGNEGWLPLWTKKALARELRSYRAFHGVGAALVLFFISVLVATATIAFLRSLQDSFDKAIFQQRQVLLGADAVISSNQELDLSAITNLPKERFGKDIQTDIVVGFTTMARNVTNGDARLAQVRAISQVFPLYGKIQTSPPDALSRFRAERGVLVEPNLLYQLGLAVGDQISIGSAQFPVIGELLSVPGEVGGFSLFAPRIYLPEQFLPQTELVTFGSQVRYRFLLKLPTGESLPNLEQVRAEVSKAGARIETVADREETVGAAIERAYLFLNLAGVITLLLGGISLAHGANALLRRKERQLAVFRCLGAPARSASVMLLVELAVLTITAALIGAALGAGVQYFLQDAPVPEPWKRLVRAGSDLGFSGKGFLEGFVLGTLATILFSLPELIRVSRQSISEIFRKEESAEQSNAERASYVLLVVLSLLAAWYVSGNFVLALKFFGASATAIFAMLLLVRAVQSVGRRLSRYPLPYPIRYSLASLYRPQTTTRATMLVFGLLGFFLLTVSFGRISLEAELRRTQPAAEQNLLLFDVQRDQKTPLEGFLRDRGYPTKAQVPIVTMRLSKLKGIPTHQKEAFSKEIPEWTLRREYRSTYRNSVETTERLVAGEWPPRLITAGVIPVSIEDGLADKLKVKLGDRLTFDIQGIELEVQIVALRTVNWRQVGTNFFFVFPEGVLDGAPQTFATLTAAPDAKKKAQLLRELATQFPNISSIDLEFIISILDSVFRELRNIVNILVGAIVVLALLLFANAIFITNEQRSRELALLRVLGATPSLQSSIVTSEYILVGAFAALSAITLAFVASFGIIHYVFEYPFEIPYGAIATLLLMFLVGAPLFASLVSRYTFQKFEILRNE